jgi:MFS family permease
MNKLSKSIQKTYISLNLLSTFAASFIWGINTLFLLDAGLSITEAFAANAFFTVGQVIFEVPTGVVADTWGRRTSYLLGAVTLLVSTLLYLLMWNIQAPFIAWAFSSALIGLGFTFFSGAVEAWLVDCLNFAKYDKSLESMFAKGQIAGGIAMLTGSFAGGVIAQSTNLGVPYIIRSVLLGVTFLVAFKYMKDLGFQPVKKSSATKQMKSILKSSIDHGLKKKSIRWVMLTAPFTFGVGAFAFYAMQPYLLELYGDETAYGIAGLAASVISGAQIFGGLIVDKVRKLFTKRTNVMSLGVIVSSLVLAIIGITSSFGVAVVMLVIWAASFAVVGPIRQAYLNKLISSKQRATVLSFDALLGSSGGVITQPALGKVADVWSYSTSYFVSGTLNIIALPLVLLARKEKSSADRIEP